MWSLEKFTSAYLFQIARGKSYDFLLIIDMKKHEITYHNYAEARRASSAKIVYSNPASDIVRSVKTTAYDQNNNIQ